MARIKKIPAAFYQNPNGRHPVREWLKGLDAEDRRSIGANIATVEYGWPIGMPTCRPLGQGLWEVRSTLHSNRIARVIFGIVRNEMVLLHGLDRKSTRLNSSHIQKSRMPSSA